MKKLRKNSKDYIQLLDYIRNKDQHWSEWDQILFEKLFGKTIESYIDYFTKIFPHLLITTYDALEEFKAERKIKESKYYV
jgi:hypothetical protein